jgi:small subunit ribosomal protein S2
MALLKNTKKVTKNNLLLEHLFLFKNHLGSRSSFRNRNIDEYIFGEDTLSNTIFNVEKTLVLFRRALNFLLLIKKENKQILFVGTGPKTRKLTKFVGMSTNQPYVQTRWVKGLLTNWESISSSVKFYNLFLKRLDLSKKAEQKLKQTFEGIHSLKELPAAVFVIDLDHDFEVVAEAKKLNIPVISIVDNNCKIMDKIDYPILSNTGSVLPLFLIISLVVETLKK